MRIGAVIFLSIVVGLLLGYVAWNLYAPSSKIIIHQPNYVDYDDYGYRRWPGYGYPGSGASGGLPGMNDWILRKKIEDLEKRVNSKNVNDVSGSITREYNVHPSRSTSTTTSSSTTGNTSGTTGSTTGNTSGTTASTSGTTASTTGTSSNTTSRSTST